MQQKKTKEKKEQQTQELEKKKEQQTQELEKISPARAEGTLRFGRHPHPRLATRRA